MRANLSLRKPILVPDWDPPEGVNCCFTNRKGGVSKKPYSSFNLAANVRDNSADVQNNRRILKQVCGLETEPLWLTQVHGNKIVDSSKYKPAIKADGCITSISGLACVVTVADCLPILITDIYGDQVAAIHAGWRGIEKNILSNAVHSFSAAPCKLRVWIGPSISRNKYEVNADLKKRFECLPSFSEKDFDKKGPKFLFDLKSYAFRELRRCGVEQVETDRRCVYTEKQLFYSYRRQGHCGRMAALIWKI